MTKLYGRLHRRVIRATFNVISTLGTRIQMCTCILSTEKHIAFYSTLPTQLNSARKASDATSVYCASTWSAAAPACRIKLIHTQTHRRGGVSATTTEGCRRVQVGGDGQRSPDAAAARRRSRCSRCGSRRLDVKPEALDGCVMQRGLAQTSEDGDLGIRREGTVTAPSMKTANSSQLPTVVSFDRRTLLRLLFHVPTLVSAIGHFQLLDHGYGTNFRPTYDSLTSPFSSSAGS